MDGSSFLCQWLAHAAIASLATTIVGSAAALVCRQPARRIRLIELTLVICVLGPLLWMIPGMPNWRVPWPPANEVEPVATTMQESPPLAPEDRNSHSHHAMATAAVADSASHSAAAHSPSGSGRDGELQESLVSPIPATEPEMGHTVPVKPTMPAAQTDWTARAGTFIVTTYLAGSGLMLMAWLVGMVRLFRVTSRTKPARTNTIGVLRDMAGPAAERTRVLVSKKVTQPTACHFGRRIIILPESLEAEGDERTLRWCLAHEWSHLERGDWWAWMLSGLVRAIFFYQPLVWWLRWQLRLCQDYLADREAAGQSPTSEDYAEFLTSRAPQQTHGIAVAGLGIRGRKSDLYRRVVMLVENRKPLERRCTRAWCLVTVLVGAAILAAVGTYGANSKDGSVPAGDKGDSFRAVLSGGVTLELVGVARNNPRPNTQAGWWKADGSALPAAPYSDLGIYSNEEGRYEVAVQVGGADDFVLSAEGPDDANVSDSGLPNSLKGEKDTGIRGFVISRIPKDEDEIDIRLAIAVGPWRTVESWKFRELDPAKGVWQDRLPLDRPAVFVNKSGIVLTPPREENHGTPGELPRTFVNQSSVVVEVTDTFGDQATRLIAVDRDDNERQGRFEIVGRGKGLKQRRFRFEGLTLDKLVGLRFEASDYMRARFERVSLRPGHRTEVDVSVITAMPGARRLAGLGYASENAASDSLGRDRGNDEAVDSAPDRGINNKSLRYDGRTFDEWRRELLIELKTERRVEALNALAAFAPHGFARETAEAVLEAKGREDFFSHNRNKDSFRSRTVSIFAGLDTIKVLPVLLETLRTGKSNDRAFACSVLSYLWRSAGRPELKRSQKPMADALVESSQDRDHRVRVVSLETARMIAPSSDALFQRLRKALHDEHPDVILVAASHGELVRPGSAPDWFVPECLALTRHKNAMVRYRAVELLASSVMGVPENAEKVVPRLIEILDEGGDFRNHTCMAIARIGPPAKKAVPALIGIVKDSKEAKERLEAATALENIGPDAKEAVSVLEPLVRGHEQKMDALKPHQLGGEVPYQPAGEDLWYRAARALRAIQDPYWFRQMRRLRSRGMGAGYDGGIGGSDEGYEMGEEEMYESGLGSPYGSGASGGGYPEMPGAGASEGHGDGGGIAAPR